MHFLISSILITAAAYFVYAASSQPTVKPARIRRLLAVNGKAARVISAVLIVLSGIPVYMSSGFAVSVFFALTMLMAIWSILVLFPPLIFKQEEKKRYASK